MADHTRDHMSADERHAHFRDHYAHGGREMPKPHGRQYASARGHGDAKWNREDRRDATHSKD